MYVSVSSALILHPLLPICLEKYPANTILKINLTSLNLQLILHTNFILSFTTYFTFYSYKINTD